MIIRNRKKNKQVLDKENSIDIEENQRIESTKEGELQGNDKEIQTIMNNIEIEKEKKEYKINI